MMKPLSFKNTSDHLLPFVFLSLLWVSFFFFFTFNFDSVPLFRRLPSTKGNHSVKTTVTVQFMIIKFRQWNYFVWNISMYRNLKNLRNLRMMDFCSWCNMILFFLASIFTHFLRKTKAQMRKWPNVKHKGS